MKMKQFCINVKAEVELEVWVEAESEEAARDYADEFNGDHSGLDEKIKEAIEDGEWFGVVGTTILKIEEGVEEEVAE